MNREEMICPYCGASVEKRKFCTKCGGDLCNVPEVIVIENRLDEKDEIRKALIGKNSEHYLCNFRIMEKKNTKDWNWCGFLFGPYWYAYRKMYSWVAIWFVIQLVIGALLTVLMYCFPDQITILQYMDKPISLGMRIFFAVMANSLYKKRIDMLVINLPADEYARQEYIRKKGGVSIPATVVTVLIVVGMLCLKFL